MTFLKFWLPGNDSGQARGLQCSATTQPVALTKRLAAWGWILLLAGLSLACLPAAAATTTYLFNYGNRAALLADGWSFIATTPGGGSRDTEQTSGAVVSYDQGEHPGVLRIPVDVGDLWANANNTRNSLFRNLSTNWTSLRLQLSFAPTVHLQQAHLVLYQNDDNYVSVGWSYFEPMSGRVVALINENGGQASPWSPRDYRSTNTILATNIHLRLDRDLTTDFVTALYSVNGTTWFPVHTTSQVLTNTKVAIWAGVSASGFPNCDLVQLDVITSNTALQPMLHTQPRQLVFNAIQGEACTNRQEVQVFLRRGQDPRNWSVSTNATWLSASVSSGATPGALDVFVNSTSLAAGRYNGKLTFTGSGLVSNQVDVILIVNPNNRVRPARWAEGYSGAMSVSTDDSYDSGSTQLFANDMRGTFYLWGITATPSWVSTFQAAGMELGTHTVSHPCFVINEPALRYELEASITQVANGAGITPGAVLSHCWPCGFVHTRGRAIAGDYFLSARGYNINQYEEATPHDFMNLKSFNSHEHNPFPPADFKTLVDGAVTTRKWLNLVLHAFNNDNGAIGYASGKDLWIRPVGDVVKYIVQRDRTIVTNYTASVTQIRFDAYRLPMPAVLFRNFETNLTANDKITFEVDVTGHPSVGALTVEGTPTPYLVRDVGAKRMLYFGTTLTTNFGNRTVILTLSNNTPVAVSQWVSTAEGNATNVTLVGSSQVGHGLNYAIVNPPTRGGLSGAPPNVIYTPNPGWHGRDAFQFTVTDVVSSLMATGTVNISISPDNQAPVLPAQNNRTIAEQTLLTVTNAATDADLPADYLSYQLLNPPAGVAISTAGVITWTPTEAQGPGVYQLITVADDAIASVTNSFTVTVNEVNVAPVLPGQTNRTSAEFSLLTVTNRATDADIPTNGLSYALTVAPSGATIDTNGVIHWSPNESQGPGLHQITTVVTDNGVPPLSATNSFQVQVNEVNEAPVLPPQTNRMVGAQNLVTVTNTAMDPDVPANSLTYSLLVSPTGAIIDTNGIIYWTPGAEFVNTTNLIRTWVVDNGVPPLSATNSFEVEVTEMNLPPAFVGTPPDISIAEHSVMIVTNNATDSDGPNPSLTYQLLDPPPGAQIDTNGVITWMPGESEGPGTNVVTTAVSDGALSVTNSFTVIVTEVNESPILPAQNNRIIAELEMLIITNAATDADLPANLLTYQLLNPPPGASISAAGVISWQPDLAQGRSTNLFTTVASDGLADVTNEFLVTVEDTFRVVATNVTLILTGAVWSYLDTGVNQGTAWREVAFDDSTWSAGPAQLGYGDGDEQTVVSYGINPLLKHTTTYFRRFFDLTGRTNFNALQLRVLRDDGVVVYLNGVEVFRDNLPEGEISYGTFAVNAITDAAESTFLVAPLNPADLLNGTNVVAVEIHQNQPASSDLSFDFELTAVETIIAPALPAQTNRTAAELTLLTITNQALDLDTPPSGLTYQLDAPPTGAVISSEGIITWFPSEEQGPGSYTLTTIVSDGMLSATNSFTVTVLEVNQAPGFATQTVAQVIAELTTLTLTNPATDLDLPANNLTYSLIPGPGSMLSLLGPTISPAGVFEWTPTEMQGPSTNQFAIVVEDDGVPPLCATNSFEVVVLEVNVAPGLPVQTNRMIDELTQLVVTNTAADSDWPTNTLLYELITAPIGAVIGTDGIITWTPTAAAGPSTNEFVTVVTDTGTPSLSATNSFTATVLDSVLLPFAIQSIATESNLIVIMWEATPGRTYRLQSKSDIVDPDWVDIGTDILAAAATVTATNALDNSVQKFYRVRLLP